MICNIFIYCASDINMSKDNYEGSNDMIVPILNRAKLWKTARKNTKKNEFGQTTVSRDDESFYDDVWDEIYKRERSDLE